MVRPVESRSHQEVAKIEQQGNFLGRCVEELPSAKDFVDYIVVNNPKAFLVASVTILITIGPGVELAALAGLGIAVQTAACCVWPMYGF